MLPLVNQLNPDILDYLEHRQNLAPCAPRIIAVAGVNTYGLSDLHDNSPDSSLYDGVNVVP